MHSAISDFKKMPPCEEKKKKRKKEEVKTICENAQATTICIRIISFLLAFLLLDYDEEIVMVIDQLSFEVKGHVEDVGGWGGAGGCELLNNLCIACS